MRTRSRKEDSKTRSKSSRATTTPDKKGNDSVAGLHQAIGNQGVLELLQAKLKVSQPQDSLEQEADQLAEQVASSGGTGSELRELLGADLDSVRIHTGPEAEEAADLLDARAFTVGRSIVFGRGEYSPGTGEGQRLIAHELAHVGQQAHGETQVQREPKDKDKAAEPKTPHDRMVVERAKQRLALLQKFVDEYAVREGRQLRAKREREATLPKREKMDLEGFDPFAEIQKRGKLEEQHIAALNTRPLQIDISESEVTFRVKFQVRFEDEKMESKFTELKSSIERGIEMVWNQTLTGEVFGGRKFSIKPEITKVSKKAPRDLNYWLITVRETDTGPVNYPGCALDQPPPDTPTSVTDPLCDGGVMSIPPSHISKPDILGHELLHLFGFVDRYMMQTVMMPGKKPRVVLESTRKTGGRPDPLGADTGKVLSEDLAFLFDRLGVYEKEESRGLDVLRQLESQGMGLGLVLAEIHRQEEIIQLGYDPNSLIKPRQDFTDKMIQQAEDL